VRQVRTNFASFREGWAGLCEVPNPCTPSRHDQDEDNIRGPTGSRYEPMKVPMPPALVQLMIFWAQGALKHADFYSWLEREKKI